MKPSPELTAYNLGVAMAVKTNRADRLTAEGICICCEHRRRKPRHRLCVACLRIPNAAAQQRNREKKTA